jgi:O-acetyl-ADP-ribose deacetylase
LADIRADLPRDKEYIVTVRLGDPGELRLVCHDITTYRADAIVNAANSELLPGGGVCGAIHRAGGPAIAEECRRIRNERGSVPPGKAVATTAGDLPAQYVIHTVGPVWNGGSRGEAEALASCYRESMRVADDLKLHSIAFPAISTGIFGYPVEQAAWVAIPTIIGALPSAQHLVFVSIVLFDRPTLDTFARAALAQRKPASGKPYEVGIGILHA